MAQDSKPEDLAIRQMTRVELDDLVDWAAREGWNPGLHDASVFWATDPDAFLAAELEGELVGGGSITSYDGDFGFMGFFIVRPEFRGRGLGNTMWHERRKRLIDRLKPGATIGLDGVFAMQDYYAQGGFAFSHRSIRYRTEIEKPPHVPTRDDLDVAPLSDVPFEHVLAYDRTCFPVPRPTFLARWIQLPDSLALGCRRGDALVGFGVVRRCRKGCKIGPLFADDPEIAETLYGRLAAFAAGGPIFLDAPENNPAAIALVERHGMKEVFGCARMYLGDPPALRDDRVFGVTTFELG